MPEPIESREQRVSGEEILNEVLRNLEDGLFPIRYTILVPSVFHVYLHPSDYEPMAGAVPFLADEIRQALNERLSQWNSGGRFAQVLEKFGASTRPKREYKILGSDWTIEFFPDPENRLQKGEIEIYSELGAPAKTEYGVGSMTQRITKRDIEGRLTSKEAPKAEAPPPPPVPSIPTAQQTHSGTTGPLEPPTSRASDVVYATLEWEDNAGPRRFEVKRNQVVIGRGGKAYWIDVKLETLPDVSREHCRLRRDPVTGSWTIKDVSQFGTTVDGARLPSSIDRSGGQERDLNIETPLADSARIGLADCITIQFSLLRRV